MVAAAGVLGHLVRGAWHPITGLPAGWWVLLVVAVHAALLGWGAWARARQQLIASLVERADWAEAEQALKLRQARSHECTSIAGDARRARAPPVAARHLLGRPGYRPDAPPDQLASVLTKRERDVVLEVGQGGRNAEIAERLHLSVPTAKTHVSHVLAKLDLGNRTQLALPAHDAGLAWRAGVGLHLLGDLRTVPRIVLQSALGLPMGHRVRPHHIVRGVAVISSARWNCYAWVALTICLVAAGVYGGASTPGAAVGAFVVAGVTCLVATVTGIVRHRPDATPSWWMITGVTVAFLLGAALRVPGEQSRVAHLIPDVFTLVGYVLFVLTVLGWLRARRGRQDWSSVADALIVGFGVALAMWALFIVPALTLPGLSAVHRVVFATYPVFDVVLLALLVQMAFSQNRRNTAFNLFMVAMVGFFLGDVGYLALDSGVSSIGRPLVDLPYFFAFGTVAAAAVHPSMRTLAARGDRSSSTRWDTTRTLSITVSLLAVGLVPIVVPARSGADVTGRVVLTVIAVAAVVLRTLLAINRFADSEAAARAQARHDSLTGLPNRSALVERLQNAARHGCAPVSVLFLDLDGFKLVNDSYGHETGDELLRDVASRLRTLLRPDDMVARLGGDEFVLVTRLGACDAARVAQRIVESFVRPFTVQVGDVFLAASIGITTVDEVVEPLDGESLVRDADIAMYAAKTSGRNQIALFDASLREKVQRRISTETALRYAVERDELELHYQPLVALPGDTVLGYEALMRWNRPGRGLVGPVDFISVAEETGLIVQMGEWAIREATRQAAAWHARGHPVHVSVNVSARQLRTRSLVGTVAAALAEVELPAQALWLELTETALVEDPETALQTLTDLRALGVTIAIDDFGTGYSSLGYLKRFPVSVVKIDREFVRDLGAAGEDDAIVRAVVAMGTALGVTLVAEGVERPDQAVALAELGCGVAQGWMYGRPVPAGAVSWSEDGVAWRDLVRSLG